MPPIPICMIRGPAVIGVNGIPPVAPRVELLLLRLGQLLLLAKSNCGGHNGRLLWPGQLHGLPGLTHCCKWIGGPSFSGLVSLHREPVIMPGLSRRGRRIPTFGGSLGV